MSLSERWLLPDGVDELLPPEAWALEDMRRAMLDTYSNYGYELVVPPVIEFIDSLLTGTGNSLDLQTFKLTDQISGRMLGVRADITPQAARIDAHLLKSQDISRLCYVDSVVRTRPEHAMTNRNPMQIGCELFGEPGVAADLEVISLMLETLRIAGVEQVHIDLAHVGIYRGLIASADLNSSLETRVFDALSRKSIPELDRLAEESDEPVVAIVRDLAALSGSVENLADVRSSIESCTVLASESTLSAVDSLIEFAGQVAKRFPAVELGYDFCELRGYNYHTGVMFSAYTPGYGYAVAKGGRYDAIGKEFGASRPATGFSADLKALVRLSRTMHQADSGIVAPHGDDEALLAEINILRKSRKVVQRLSKEDTLDYGCKQQLVLENGCWTTRDL